jgi:hypothetical protein
MEYLDLLAENTQNWDTTDTYETPSKTQHHTSSGGMYNLREDHDLQTKFASLARCRLCLSKHFALVQTRSKHFVSFKCTVLALLY